MDLTAETPELMAEKVYNILKEVVKYKPDFVVLPESFPYVPNKLTINQKVAVSDCLSDAVKHRRADRLSKSWSTHDDLRNR